jgi:hypothetical protein
MNLQHTQRAVTVNLKVYVAPSAKKLRGSAHKAEHTQGHYGTNTIVACTKQHLIK